MQLIRGLKNLTTHTGSVVTIGNFDGVHIGHQKIIDKLVTKSKLLNLPSVLISFVPTPQSFFGKEQATLSSFQEKHELLSQSGLDEHLIIRFNQNFSQLSAKTFIEKILVDQLNIKYCLIGDDFRFGQNRQGDFKFSYDYGKKYNFSVEDTPSVMQNNERISSSKIRSMLQQGKLDQAQHMLGRAFSISGKIVHGQKKGRTIGFPTINIPIKRKVSPVLGVFAVTVTIQNTAHQGVCNIGKRPTVNGHNTLLEVFIFNFDQQVYGQSAQVTFIKKIRDEKKFDSFDQLKQQIDQDVLDAKAYFKG